MFKNPKLFLYNTLSRKKEEFKPIIKGEVGLYTCGPTVYNYAHLGNLRSYLFEDILKRTLEYNNYKVKHVMNITDVGHLTGDMDMGEDKMKKGEDDMVYFKCPKCGKWSITGIQLSLDMFFNFKNSKSRESAHPRCTECLKSSNLKEGIPLKRGAEFINSNQTKVADEIAEFYTEAFKKDLNLLNIENKITWAKVTKYIDDQVALIEILKEKGFTYQTSDGVYFDTSKIKNYNKLSHLPLEKLKEGARVEINVEKKNPTDFALWKFSPYNSKRQMEWDSPWGIGFPGWHIECSAISLKLLKDQLDIHCGGIDHINIHHTNEIAQSEAATGKKFFNYWLHGAFLNIKGGKKMAKSADNFLTLENALVKKDLDPLAYRFAALQVHYRKPMEYSEAGLRQAQVGLEALEISCRLAVNFKLLKLGMDERKKTGKIDKSLKTKFLEAINDDLNMPKALAVVFAVLKSKISPNDKKETIVDFDKVLGLNLKNIFDKKNNSENTLTLEDLPSKVQKLIQDRQIARNQKDYKESDRLREAIKECGYSIEDSGNDLPTIFRHPNLYPNLKKLVNKS